MMLVTTTTCTGDEKMTATRDIEIGEEVCYEYATSEMEESAHVPLHCLCGKTSCRKLVSGKEYLDPAFQAKYQTHFTEYVMKKLAK